MFLKRLLPCCGLLFSFNCTASALTLSLLSNHSNVGDHNQALGIATALKALTQEDISVKDIDTKTTAPSSISTDVEKALTHGKVIVVGSGEGGIEGIADLSPHQDLIICLTSHMFLKRYNDPELLGKVTFIALPTHISKEEKALLGEKLIETVGVAHNRQVTEIDQTFKDHGRELPDAPSYFGVILGGDAPVPSSQDIKLFTEEDALKLAEYVAKIAPTEAAILVLNGPRTGKYDGAFQEIPTVHRKGESDRITKRFMQELRTRGREQAKLFDFQHTSPENKDWVSPYNAVALVAGALKVKNGKILVPGESTTSISEAVDVLSPDQIIVYENNAMNEVHTAHVKSEWAAGRVAVVEGYEISISTLR